MREIWIDIPGYSGYYQASSLGQIRSLDRVTPHARYGSWKRKGRILRQHENGGGYLAVALCNGEQKNYDVHRLVALTFIGQCPDGTEVCHGPNGQLDNSIENLRYRTRSENQQDRVRDGTSKQKRVRRSDGIEFDSLTLAAEETNCSKSNISNVCRGVRKTSGGYGWEYIDEG